MIFIACNAPLLAVKQGFTSTGAVKYMPLGRYSPGLLQNYPDAIKIPCGKCRGCRAQKARAWADRMVLELDHSPKAIFLTLTYNDEHVPCRFDQSTGQAVLSLNKRDLQLFFKRLRKFSAEKVDVDGKKDFISKEIRYYACGEYGSRTHRPHYHAILYGLDLEDFPDRKLHGVNELGNQFFISDILQNDIWKNGYCYMSDVSWNTCAYVARYVKKKDMGLVTDEYVDRVLEPEFSVSSRNPGIGLYYPKEHPDCFEYSVHHFGDNGSSVEVYLPSAFLRSLKESKFKRDNDLYEELMSTRRKAMYDVDFSKMMQTNRDYMDLGDMAEEKLNLTGNVIDYYRGL